MFQNYPLALNEVEHKCHLVTELNVIGLKTKNPWEFIISVNSKLNYFSSKKP